jgi:hypothetical protein
VPLFIFIVALYLFSSSLMAMDHYELQVEADLSSVEVKACFDGQPPEYLQRNSNAGEFTDWIRLDDRAVQNTGSRVSLADLPKNGCASWRVNLAAASTAGDYRLAIRINDAVLSAGNLWFWRDGEMRSIEVRTRLPKGMELSTPWPEADPADGYKHYHPAATSASWSSRLALGHFAHHDLRMGNTRLRIALLGDFDVERLGGIVEWLREPAQSVQDVMGRFPQEQPQVLVVGIGPRSSAVPWARVIRGGGAAVELFVDETRPLQEYRQDWTATHEFSHWLLPFVASQDRWLSEGLASYYQNVLRARDGRLSEKEAWEKLKGGFDRGQNDNKPGGTMDTYWRGASILLQADSNLRAVSNNKQSLDTALEQLHDCCYDPGRGWRAKELFQKLDQLTGYKVFGELYLRHALKDAFPDPEPTLEKLGVVSDWAGLKLENDAPWSRIRQSIMNEGALSTERSDTAGQ